MTSHIWLRRVAVTAGASLVLSTLPLPAKANLLNPAPDCGPMEYPNISRGLGWFLLPWSPFFNAACKKHDANYLLADTDPNMTQTKADKIFLSDMKKSCKKNWDKTGKGTNRLFKLLKPALLPFKTKMISWCTSYAQIAYSVVSEFGSDIDAIKGINSIKVESAKITRTKDTFSDDEIDIVFKVRNNGNVNIEVDAVMMKKGHFYKDLVQKDGLGNVASFLSKHTLDTEPDLYEKDLKPGQSYSDKLTTSGIYASQEDLGKYVYAFIRADLVESFGGIVPMARLKCRKPAPGKTKNCQIRYRSFQAGTTWVPQSRMERFRSANTR